MAVPKGEDIIKTLIELLEAQEQIKITYTLGKLSDLSEEERAERQARGVQALEEISKRKV